VTDSGRDATPTAGTAGRLLPVAVLEERVALLYRHVPSGIAANLATVLVLAGLLWGHVPAAWLLAWLAAMLLQALSRALCLRQYRRRAPAPVEAGRWGWLLAGLHAIGGCLWGVAGFAFFKSDPATQVFLTMVLAGAVTASVGSLAAFYPAYLFFAVAAILPFTLRLALEGGAVYWGMSAITLVFLLLNLAVGRRILKALDEAIRLRIQNQDLAQALLRQKEIAEEASVAKTKFLAAASHDLRQPVHAIQLFADLLEHDLAGSPQSRIVRNIKSAAGSLQELLNALLDFSKIDAAVIRPATSDFPIAGLFASLEQEFERQAYEKGLRFRVMPCRLWVRSDPALLERMLRNLVSNAIRYTKEGGVAIGCRREGAQLRLQVSDTGPGIPGDLQREIFREFYQLGNPERDLAKGLGLGLAIVDGLARLLGHAIAVESRQGRGSTFSIRVPLGAPAAAGREERPASHGDLEDVRVLVIDDDALIRDAAQQLLERWGCRALAAESAEAALAAMDGARFVPQLILADYRLREEATGAEAIRRIQAALGAPVPAALITGDTAPDRLLEARSSGYPLLHKPIDGGKLRTLLTYLMLQHEGEPSRAD